jgi:7-cyano-7-deazaguanine reductase
MTGQRDDKGMLLGRQVPAARVYDPGLLYPIPRSASRESLGMDVVPHGVDLWHAYEMSWLDKTGKPLVRVGRFTVPVSSANIVESKSFKLYLNSLNNERFDSEADAVARIVSDVSAVVGEAVDLEVLPVDDPSLSGASLSGECLDALPVVPDGQHEPEAGMLSLIDGGSVVEEQLYSHLLRSLCPVTGQPDWASVWVHYRGKALDRELLLMYLLAFRDHHEFHEQCVERMFHDIRSICTPDFLHVQGLYTRRGGMDINPFRSTDPRARPLPRMNRQ